MHVCVLSPAVPDPLSVRLQRATHGQPVDFSASSESWCWLMSLWMPRKWSPVECADLCSLPPGARFPTDTVAPQWKFNQQWDATRLPVPPVGPTIDELIQRRASFTSGSGWPQSRSYCWRPFDRLVWFLSAFCCMNSVMRVMVSFHFTTTCSQN